MENNKLDTYPYKFKLTKGCAKGLVIETRVDILKEYKFGEKFFRLVGMISADGHYPNARMSKPDRFYWQFDIVDTIENAIKLIRCHYINETIVGLNLRKVNPHFETIQIVDRILEFDDMSATDYIQKYLIPELQKW